MFKKFKEKRCYNGGNKHNFQPRYDEKHNGCSVTASGFVTADDIRKMTTDYTYIKDVCIWCGKEIRR